MQKSFITDKDMEFITEKILANANLATTWQGYVAKTDIDSIIEFEYGLDIQWENIDHLCTDGIVLAAIIPDQKLIYMNESQKCMFVEKMGTMNFSKAHELGHWILHVTEQQEYEQLSFGQSDRYFCRSNAKRMPEEIQADMFAAAILMPKEIITGAISDLISRKRVVLRDLYILKDSFEVSISALTNRIRALKLLYIDDNGKIFMNEAEALGQLTLFDY